MTSKARQPFMIGLLCFCLLGTGYLFGYSVGHENLVFDKNYKPTLTNTEFGRPKDVDFSLFWEVWDKVKGKYAGEINNQQMVYDAINGALKSLDDPYTLFLEPEDAKRLKDDLSGSFEGIGAEIEKRDELIRVVVPLTDSPAERAGVKAKDIILKIDDTETKDMNLEEAIKRIRGTKGSAVKLTVIHEDASEPTELTVTRDTIVIKSVKWEMKDNNIAYLKLAMFGEDTEALIDQALTELLAKNPKGLVVDVRNNPGGFLDGAIDITSLFLKDRGIIVKEQDKDGKITEHKATTPVKAGEIPIVVLINGGSASASEIYAGALQDYGRAKLVGEKTYGKGSVQEIEEIRGGAAIRVTIAKWLTPKDRQINKVGISPDIEVKLTDEDVKADKDPQLERALQELNK